MNKVGDLFMTRTRRTFTPEFKLQMVRLFENEKSKYEIVREYDLTPSALDKWIKNHQNSGSFNTVDNLTVDEKELRKLCKESRQLKMRNDILKQTALIMGKK
ncbi:transposase [Macrococcoides caseolyticum]|uniref:transposase n=1 Tax=Macrococcoides caseolyticum TaxID=69966 RepID=UPI00339D6076